MHRTLIVVAALLLWEKPVAKGVLTRYASGLPEEAAEQRTAHQQPLAEGVMTRYAPGLMEEVVERRIAYQQLLEGTEPRDCVALMDCSWLGQSVWLELPTGEVTGPHPVADCSASEHREQHEQMGLAVEVSAEYAEAVCVPAGAGGQYCLPWDGPLPGVKVWARRPAPLQP